MCKYRITIVLLYTNMVINQLKFVPIEVPSKHFFSYQGDTMHAI